MRGNTEQRQGALDKRPGPDSRRIECWTVDEVVDWLRRIGLQKYQGTFRANRINGELLLELNEKQLEKLLMNDPIHRLRFSLALKDERERRSEKTGYIINGTKNADKALTFLKDWITAVTGFQTALIVAVGILIEFRDEPLIASLERIFLYFSISAFVISIIIGTMLLNMLPGASQREPANRKKKYEDIYAIRIGNITINRLAWYFRWSFVVGIVLFGIFVAVRFFPDSWICDLDEWLPDFLGTCSLAVEEPDLKHSLGLVQAHRIDRMDTKAWW